MDTFSKVCTKLNIPVADEKIEGPSTIIEYLGLTTDTERMIVRFPDDKILDLRNKIEYIISSKKVILRNLQSIAGSLRYCQRDQHFPGVYMRHYQKHANRFISYGLQIV